MAATATVFNQEQQQIIDDLSGHLLVLAPAGTGKTNTLSHRIASILERELAGPEEILCLTFTNRACREMSERIAAVVGDRAEGVTVRTIHGFCYQMLREYAALAGEDGDRAVWDDEDSMEVLRELLLELNTAKPREERHKGAQAARNYVELVKHQMYRADTDDIDDAVALVLERDGTQLREQICLDSSFQQDAGLFRFFVEQGAELYRRYDRRLLSEKAYDFPGLLLGLHRMMAHPDVAAALRARYRYVHIDEVQDISDIEYGLVTALAPQAVFLLCGDGNQTIYGWRGSVPDQILPRFQREYGAEVIRLDKNYRSSPGLQNLAARFSAIALGSGSPPPRIYTAEEVEAATLATVDEQINWMYHKVREIPCQGDYSRVAVLCRSNAACQTIADGFAAIQRETGDYTVRFMLASEFKLFKRREIKDILAFLRFLLHPEDGTALRRLVEHYVKGGRGLAARIVAELPETGAELTDLAHPRTHRDGDYFALLTGALHSGDVVVFDVESTGVNVYRDRIVQIAAIRIDSKGCVVERFEEFLRSPLSVGDSARVHGFTDEFLRENGGDPDEILPRFLEFLRGRVVVGHNVNYDMSILGEELRRRGLPSPDIAGVYDTLPLARRFLPDAPNHKLETLAALLETPNKPSHDAMDDILATGDLLLHFVRREIIPQEESRRMFYSRYREQFARLTSGMERLRGEMEEMSAPAFVTHLVEDFGIRAKHQKDPDRMENLDAFLRFLGDGGFESENPKENIYRIIEYSALSSSELDRMTRSSRKMAIITIHQAKGCEFDHVFLPNLVEYIFPNFQAVRSGVLDEEARLFYVAATRAREKLYLSSYSVNPRTGRPAEPSSFLNML